MKQSVYSEEEMMFGIRRAMMGKAGDKLTRMGSGMTVARIVSKFESEYGLVDTMETVLGKLFNCKQGPKETITDYASRIEELSAQAAKLDGSSQGDDKVLKNILYQGLRKEFSLRAAYKNDIIEDYDKFKLELRKIESELSAEQSETKQEPKKCNAAVNIDNGNTEMRALFEKLNSRIDQLEKDKNNMQQQLQQQLHHYQVPGQYSGRGARGNSRGRGFRDRGTGPRRGQGRGDDSYSVQRPVASNTFTPRKCYNCNDPNHMARDCPHIKRCYHCNASAHLARNCPNM